MKILQDFGPLDVTILVASLSTSLLYGLRIRTPPDSLRMTFKAISTASLSLLCAINGKPWLLVAALASGAVGDAFLAWPGESSFLRGLGSFLIGHLCYFRLFARVGRGIELVRAESWRQLLGVAMLALAPTMGFVLVPRVGPALRWPIAVYSALSLGVVSAALTISHQHTVTGAILFALSDCLLAADEFLLPADSKHHSWMQYSVWILYYSGQMLIASGFMNGI